MYVITESSGEYEDYSDNIVFLVETESDAKEICQFYNDYVTYQQDACAKVSEYRNTWEQENPNTFTANITKRTAQVKEFLTMEFKKEIQDKLIAEYAELTAQHKASVEWNNQSWKATNAFRETLVTPERFNKIKDNVYSGAHFSYFMMDVSKKEDVLCHD